MSNDVAEPRRGGRERKQVEKFEPQRKLFHALGETGADRSGGQKGKARAVESDQVC
jgi:hypothetical protein